MKPALDIHPSWVEPQSTPVSGTWRWYFLERWLEQAPLASAWLLGPIHLDAHAPDSYAAILQAAAWIVAESIRRDGISRGRLSSDDMRWSRRLGLALMGDGPVAGADLLGGLRASVDREQHALDVVWRVVEFFPASDQSVLRLALPASAPRAGSLPLPQHSGKTITLIRLAKRHAAARLGVDLSQVTTVDFDPSAKAPIQEELRHVG